MPDHHCQFSRGCDRRRGRTPISLDPLKERLQRTWRRLRGPRRLDKHLAGVRVSLLADPSVARRAIAGLANLRRQSEIATQLLRRLEPRDIADRGQDGQCDDWPDAGDRHQANHSRVFKGFSDDRHIEFGELIRIALQFVDQPTDDRFFLLRQRQASQPFLAGLAEQMARVLRDQICMQDRVNTSLGADDLLENAHALNRLSPLALGVVVRNPDLR